MTQHNKLDCDTAQERIIWRNYLSECLQTCHLGICQLIVRRYGFSNGGKVHQKLLSTISPLLVFRFTHFFAHMLLWLIGVMCVILELGAIRFDEICCSSGKLMCACFDNKCSWNSQFGLVLIVCKHAKSNGARIKRIRQRKVLEQADRVPLSAGAFATTISFTSKTAWIMRMGQYKKICSENRIYPVHFEVQQCVFCSSLKYARQCFGISLYGAPSFDLCSKLACMLNRIKQESGESDHGKCSNRPNMCPFSTLSAGAFETTTGFTSKTA